VSVERLFQKDGAAFYFFWGALVSVLSLLFVKFSCMHH